MTDQTITIAALAAQVGHVVGQSGWHLIDQDMINRFADLTLDRQFIHLDTTRAAHTPFGATIAHGFLTLSLLSVMAEEALPPIANLAMSINYGFDSLRFVAPVRAGSAVRAQLLLANIDTSVAGQVQLAWDVTVEIADNAKPAIVARWLHRHYPTET